MKTLNAHQIDIVVMAIEMRKVKDNELQEQLIDHICCMLEELLEKGHSFESGLKQCLKDFSKEEFNQIEIEIVKSKKYTIMKNVLVFSLLIFLISSTFLISQESFIPDLNPIAAKHRISSGFGEKVHPITKVKRHHDGLDIVAPIGTPIISPADGEVIETGKGHKGYGTYLKIRHDDQYVTFYSHLSELLVSKGDKVKKGIKIGKVGTTGLSTGPHLHYEVILNGEKVNPLLYFKDTVKASM